MLFAIDIEASGLTDESYPVEIGIVGPEGSYRWLIRPEPEWTHWDENAQAIHGLRPEELESGTPASQVAREVSQLLGDAVVYSDAPAFDGFWLGRLFETVPFEPRFRLQWVPMGHVDEPLPHRAVYRAEQIFQALTGSAPTPETAIARTPE